MPRTERRIAITQRLKQVGKFDEYQARVEALKAEGKKRDEIYPVLDQEFAHYIADVQFPWRRPKPQMAPSPIPVPEATNRRVDSTYKDIKFAFESYALKGEELEHAKATASKGGLTMLTQIIEDREFRKYFFTQLVPKLIASQQKMDDEIRGGRQSKAIIEVIEDGLMRAREAAGAYPLNVNSKAQSQRLQREDVVALGAEGPSAEPPVSEVPDPASGSRPGVRETDVGGVPA